MRNGHKRTLMSLAIVSALGASEFALAQEAVLEEVVVTARKRAESLQDVPMAVSAFNSAQLQDAQVTGMEDLQRMTPNITLTETSGLQAGAVAVFIRGIGNEAQFDQGVGIYVDDIYMNRATGSLLEVYDVERIEILKGPQGNLYGRNTIGGAIKYVSREPTDEVMGDVEVRAGEFDLLQVKGNISGPIIGDTLLGSFGALYRERDAIQENTFDGSEFWDQDVSAYRGSLVWNATDSLRIKLAGDYQEDSSAPRIPNRSGVDAALLGEIGFFISGANIFLAPGTGLTNEPNDTSLAQDPDEVSTEQVALLNEFEIESTTLAMTIDWDISDTWSFKSITAQRETDHTQPFDFDGSEQRFIHTINYREFEDFSQEFQFNYNSDSIAAVMGYYYLDGDTDINGSTTQYPRLRATQTLQDDTSSDKRELESQSVYANVDWNITESWQLSLGGRYTKDEKEQRSEAVITQELYALALANSPFGIIPLAIAPGQEATAAASPNFFGWATPYTESITISTPELQEASDEWSEFSPSARLSWFAGDDLLFYAGFSSGFKSGGFNNNSDNAASYEPEVVDAYTLGMKSTLLDGTLRFNGEIFFNDYTEKQLANIVLDEQGNFGQFVDNVGEVETSGVEFETTWLPLDGLLVGLNVGYLDTEVTEYETLAAGDLSDTTEIGFSPEWSVQARLSYDFDLSDWGSLMLGTDVSYRTESYTNSPIDTTSPAAEAQIQEEHAIWNAIASFRSANGNWRVSLEGKNLEDKRVITNTFDLGVFQTAGYNNPRTWAVSLGYEF